MTTNVPDTDEAEDGTIRSTILNVHASTRHDTVADDPDARAFLFSAFSRPWYP